MYSEVLRNIQRYLRTYKNIRYYSEFTIFLIHDPEYEFSLNELDFEFLFENLTFSASSLSTTSAIRRKIFVLLFKRRRKAHKRYKPKSHQTRRHRGIQRAVCFGILPFAIARATRRNLLAHSLFLSLSLPFSFSLPYLLSRERE